MASPRRCASTRSRQVGVRATECRLSRTQRRTSHLSPGFPPSPSCDASPDGTGWDVTVAGVPSTAYYATETTCEAFPEASWDVAFNSLNDGSGNSLDPTTFAALQEVIE